MTYLTLCIAPGAGCFQWPASLMWVWDPGLQLIASLTAASVAVLVLVFTRVLSLPRYHGD